MDPESAKKFVLEKLRELWLLLASFASYLLGILDEKFPPETREEKIHHWLEVGKPWLITASVLLVLYCCCCKKRRGRKMKAPGQDMTIYRDAFERSPKSYFRDLRGKKQRSQLLG